MTKLGVWIARHGRGVAWMLGMFGVLGLLGPGAARAQTAADSAAVVATALDYIQGWYAGDSERMARALHPDLVKRIVLRGAGGGELLETNRTQLVENTGRGGGSNTPVERRMDEVTILDMFHGVASVKIVAADWIDYLHLAKVNGRWVILNALWEVKRE